jgi:cytochrome P450
MAKLADPMLQTAVIHETLRISSPAPGTLTRLVPAEGARYGSHLLPADVRLNHAV